MTSKLQCRIRSGLRLSFTAIGESIRIVNKISAQYLFRPIHFQISHSQPVIHMPFFGYGGCDKENCAIEDLHCHSNSPPSPALKSSTEGKETPTEESTIRLTPIKSTAQLESPDTNHLRIPNNSGATSPSPVDGPADRRPSNEDIYRSAAWQPSLVRGGGVDLSWTFTPTPYGTFSFGGQRKGA
jgi:hypothetical protein